MFTIAPTYSLIQWFEFHHFLPSIYLHAFIRRLFGGQTLFNVLKSLFPHIFFPKFLVIKPLVFIVRFYLRCTCNYVQQFSEDMMKTLLLFALLFVMAQSAIAQWSSTPNSHIQISPEGQNVKSCSDNNGGIFVFYNNFHYTRNRVYMQHVDKFGVKKLDSVMVITDIGDIQNVYDVAGDGEGGFFICIGVSIKLGQSGGGLPKYDTKLYIQRVDKNLNKLWGVNGLRVSLDTIHQGIRGPQIINDDKNSVYVLWVDEISEGGSYKNNVYLQRITHNGAHAWGDTAKKIFVNILPHEFLFCRLKNTVVTTFVVTQTPPIKSKTVCFDSTGSIVWEKLYEDVFYHQKTINAKSFLISRNVNLGSGRNVFEVNLVDTVGNFIWNDWLTVADSSAYPQFAFSLSVINDTVFALNYVKQNLTNFSNDFYTQVSTSSGKLLFENGLKLTKDHLGVYASGVLLRSTSTEFISFFAHKDTDGVFNTYVQKVNLKGELLWGDSGKILSNVRIPDLNTSIIFKAMVSDMNGGIIAVGSSEPSSGIYLQQVSKDGNLGDIITYVSKEIPLSTVPTIFEVSEPYPNPFNPSTTLDITIRTEGEFTVSTYNLLGKLINQRKVYLKTGTYNYKWNNDAEGAINSGTYFFRVTDSKHQSLVKKLLLLK